MANVVQKSILVIDDNRTFVMYLGLLLKRMGFEVIPSNNPLDALKLLKVLTPDLILLDVHMPEIDGIKILTHIRNDPDLIEIPVVMISIDSDPELIKKCEALGCSDFLQKPIDLRKLHETVQSRMRFPGSRRRRFIRTPFAARVTIEHESKTTEHYAVSLSEGGIYLRAKDPLPVGAAVTVRLSLGQGREITMEGYVIYRKDIFQGAIRIEPGMAIHFSRVRKKDAFLLRRFIGNLLAGDLIEEQEEPVLHLPDKEGES